MVNQHAHFLWISLFFICALVKLVLALNLEWANLCFETLKWKVLKHYLMV